MPHASSTSTPPTMPAEPVQRGSFAQVSEGFMEGSRGNENGRVMPFKTFFAHEPQKVEGPRKRVFQ